MAKNKDTRGDMDLTMKTMSMNGDGLVYEVEGNSLFELHRLLKNLAKINTNILFLGERGTGKEKFADFFSKLVPGEFKAINCSAFDDTLLRSELFGHAKGAFTGAIRKREGLFQSVNNSGGVIFLDEIGDASPSFHAAILRVLQTRDFSSVGSEKTIKLNSNVRIIAATSKESDIRDDLLDRFKKIYIPPLKYRNEDIPYLIRILAGEITQSFEKNDLHSTISGTALSMLKEYDWPGNVRELKSSLETAFILCSHHEENTLRPKHFPQFRISSNDTSKARVINSLPNSSKKIPVENFLVPTWPTLTTVEQPKETKQKVDHLTETIKDVPPDTYREKFWNYHANKKHGNHYMHQVFDINRHTANDNFKKARKRLSQQPVDEKTSK